MSFNNLGEMRGEEKPYDMQAPCNDSELAKAIENDREIEDMSASSILTSSSVLELPMLRTSNASTVAIPSTSVSIPNNDVSSTITSNTKPFNLTLPDSPIVSFPNICSLLNGDEMDIKDHINEPISGVNKPLNLKPNLGKNIPPTISLPTTPLPLSSTTITLPTQPVNLYNAKLQTPSPKVFSSLSNQHTTPLFFAVDINGDAKRDVSIQKTREISKSYAPFQANASLSSPMVINNQLGCSISVGSVDSSTMSLSPCPSSSGSSSSPHSYSSQSINGPITTPDLGLCGSESISISPAALHLSSSLISSHLPHSLDSLLTPAASPEDDSLEPWIQTV